jgi:hypothetical protein
VINGEMDGFLRLGQRPSPPVVDPGPFGLYFSLFYIYFTLVIFIFSFSSLFFLFLDIFPLFLSPFHIFPQMTSADPQKYWSNRKETKYFTQDTQRKVKKEKKTMWNRKADFFFSGSGSTR